MNIQIPPDLNSFVEELVAGGKYGSPDQVFVEGLRLLQVREQLRRDVDLGIAQLDRGEGIEGEVVFERGGRFASGARTCCADYWRSFFS